jgi:hypothetical protein
VLADAVGIPADLNLNCIDLGLLSLMSPQVVLGLKDDVKNPVAEGPVSKA